MMPDKKYGFTYTRNGFTPLEYNAYNYYIRLVERYQDDRREEKWNTGTFDEQQLIKRHYLTTPVTYLSHIEPLEDTGILFANRPCGYLAFSNTLPKKTLDPLRGLNFKSVSNFFEYLSYIQKTAYAGFFSIGQQLCCYATVTHDDVKVVTAKGDISLLLFCESYTYTPSSTKAQGVIGQAVLSSAYFNDLSVNVYTADSLAYMDNYYVYALTSSSDPHPVGKVPGEPMLKTLIMNGFDSSVTKLKIDETEITLASQLNKVIVVSDDRFYQSYLALKYTGNGKVEVGFVFPYKEDPQLDSIRFAIQYYKDNAWSETQTCQVFFHDNEVSSLTNLLTVDVQKYYLDVPMHYTLRVQNRYFFQHPTNQKTTTLTYAQIDHQANVYYKGTSNGQYVYQTDYITISAVEGHTPKEFVFTMTDTFDKVNGFVLPVWVYGYTVGEIDSIPNGSVIVTPKMTSSFAYTEYANASYTIEFSYIGDTGIERIEVQNIFDRYGYFQTEDFQLTKAASVSGKITYTLTLNKKIIANPIANLTQIPVSMNFFYFLDDGTILHSETFHHDLTLSYVKDRWSITELTSDNTRLGETVLSYKIKDKLLNRYTDKYAQDARLAPAGQMVFSANVTALSDTMDWDIHRHFWMSTVNVTDYGDIVVQFKGVNAQSDSVTLKHDKPTHPLTLTPSVKQAYVGIQTRVVFTLKYSDDIKAIYVSGKLVGTQTPLTFKGVTDDTVFLTAIFTTDNKRIQAIAVDLIPNQEGSLTLPISVTRVNDHDYSTWPATASATLSVKAQSEGVNFTFTVGEDFAFGQDSTGVLDLHDTLLSDAKIVATVVNPSTNKIVARPNFNPVTQAKFDTINLFLDKSLSSQKTYILDFEVYEYEFAEKDNSLPQYLYYHTQITFKVP